MTEIFVFFKSRPILTRWLLWTLNVLGLFVIILGLTQIWYGVVFEPTFAFSTRSVMSGGLAIVIGYIILGKKTLGLLLSNVLALGGLFWLVYYQFEFGGILLSFALLSLFLFMILISLSRTVIQQWKHFRDSSENEEIE